MTWRNEDEIQSIQNQSVENEVIGCHRLRVLHINIETPKLFFPVIAPQCPLLGDLGLNSDVPKNDIFAAIDQCKALHSVTFIGWTSTDVLSYLCFSENLVNITLDISSLPNAIMLKSYLKELPFLRRLYLYDWFEDGPEFNLSESNLQSLISDNPWREAEVNQLRRYVKPHHDGLRLYIFGYVSHA